MRRTTKVLLWIVTLLLAIASAAIALTFLILEWPRAASARVEVAERTSEPRPANAQAGTARRREMEGRGTTMTEGVTAYAYQIGQAVAPYILHPALIRLAGIAFIIAVFWMLIVMTIMND